MGADLASSFPVCRETFEQADEILGYALSRLCFEGPAQELTLTANTQPAILTVSVAIVRILASHGLKPSFVAGHSLGEYSALVCAGSLSFQDALRAVRLRGEAMQEAVPAGEGAMAAILGLSPDAVTEICREAAGSEIVSPANLNSPEQTVIAGHAGAVARASKLAVERGAMRAVALPVSAPFHCALMRPAEIRLAEHLSGVPFADPDCPVVTNVDASAVRSGAEARDALIRQVCSPVMWSRSIETLKRIGTRTFVETGPGKVLTGLMRRIDRGAESQSVEDSSGVEAALRRFGPPRAESETSPSGIVRGEGTA